MASKTHSSAGLALTGALDRLVEPPLRRNFLAFLGDYVIWGVGIAFVNPSTVLPALVRQLTDSPPVIGLVETVRSGVWFLPQLFVAWLLSGTVIRRRHMVIPFIISRSSMLLIVVVLLLLARTQPLTAAGLLLACLAFYFIMDASGSVPWFDLLSHSLPPHGRTRLMGLGQFLSGGLGIGVGVAVAAILADTRLPFPVNYSLLFILACSLFAVEVFVVSRVRVSRPADRRDRIPLAEFVPRLLGIFRRDLRFRRLLLVRLVVGASGLSTPFYIICALDRLGMGAASVGIFTAAQIAGGIAGAPFIALLAERRGVTSVIRIGASFALILPIIAISMVTAGLSLSHDLRIAVFGLLFVLNGAMANMTAAGFTNYMLDIAPAEQRPTYVGFANTFNGLILFFPIVGGWILGDSSWVALFAVTAAAALVGLVGTLRMSEPRQLRR
ncbi:MAG TPA: MFS transporter [Spirochaetia bacterium]|nr:MFS transporter [Spirochaetia bacterium]